MCLWTACCFELIRTLYERVHNLLRLNLTWTFVLFIQVVELLFTFFLRATNYSSLYFVTQLNARSIRYPHHTQHGGGSSAVRSHHNHGERPTQVRQWDLVVDQVEIVLKEEYCVCTIYRCLWIYTLSADTTPQRGETFPKFTCTDNRAWTALIIWLHQLFEQHTNGSKGMYTVVLSTFGPKWSTTSKTIAICACWVQSPKDVINNSK